MKSKRNVFNEVAVEISDEERHHLDERGYVRLEQVLTMKQLQNAKIALANANPAGNCNINDERVGPLWHNSRVLAAVDHVLGSGFRLDGFYGRIADSPTRGKFHRDADRSAANGESYRCLAIFPLDAFRQNNGATRVIPGSHLWADLDGRDTSDEVAMVGVPGDAIVFNGSVFHAVGANTGGSSRRSMFVSYVREGAGPGDRHNQSFSISREFLEQLPATARHML